MPDLDKTQERGDFEAWFEREYPTNQQGRREKYLAMSVQDLMRSAWQAARSLPPLQVGAGGDRAELRKLIGALFDTLKYYEDDEHQRVKDCEDELFAYIDAIQVAPESAKGLTEAMHRDHATSRAAMEFAANLCRLGVETIKGRDYVALDAVMNEVAAWRKAFDAVPAVDYRAFLAKQGAKQ